MMPIVLDSSVEELQQQLHDYARAYTAANGDFERAKTECEAKQEELADAMPKLENIQKKIDMKTAQVDSVKQQLSEEQSERHGIEQQLPKLTKKLVECDEEIRKCQEKVAALTKIQAKVSAR
jgi:chromosome segregation ATPase